MTIQSFQLQGDFIELNVLLKLLALAPSGGAAKALIGAGAVRVDGEVEARVRRKLRAGDVVRVGDAEIRIVAADQDPAVHEPGAASQEEPRQRRTAVTPFPGKGDGGKAQA